MNILDILSNPMMSVQTRPFGLPQPGWMPQPQQPAFDPMQMYRMLFAAQQAQMGIDERSGPAGFGNFMHNIRMQQVGNNFMRQQRQQQGTGRPFNLPTMY